MIYRSLIKPLLFTLNPETAHNLGIASLKVLGLPVIRPVVNACLRVTDPALQVTLNFGPRKLTFPNPVGLAAGFDKNAEATKGFSALGFGFLEVGTLTPRPQPGNPKPRIFRVPESGALINRLGFNNRGIPGAGKVPALDIPMGFNIGKNKDTPNDRAAEDYLACLEAFAPRADFFVVNVSSPNTPGLRDLQSPAALSALLKALVARRDQVAPRAPLFVKISPDEDGEASAVAALEAGFDGIVATNTTKSRDGVPPTSPTGGGLSGRPLFARSTEWVRRIRRATGGKLAIIGVGGIFSARDAYEKILAGASLVEVYTGLIYNGPGFVRRINKGLAEFLRADGFSSIQEAVGKKSL